MADEGEDRGSIVGQIRSGVTAITLIVGVVVSLNTFLTTCSSQKIADHADFRKAVQAEETYWTGLFKDYEASFAGEYKTDAERREARLFVISQLAAHTPPDFAEYKVPKALKDQAQAQFRSYQDALNEALLKKSTPEIETALQTQVDAQANATIDDRPANGALPKDPPKEVVQTVAPTATPSLGNTVLSARQAQGWDVDVFWCQGFPGDNDNYLTASRVATALAARSKAGTPVAEAAVGRVRLRPLPAALNSRPGYNATGLEVRYEEPKERRFADGLLAMANSLQPRDALQYRLKTVGNVTPWYVSLFACAASPPPAAPAR